LIPREIIDEIRQRCDIEDVIGSYVTLKRTGANVKGLCPFHSEKTPSFTVYPANQSFYCFGCGAGGDVITFTMKYHNLDYMGAVEYLASRAGISLPQNGEQAGISKGSV
jgi:DNA primase